MITLWLDLMRNHGLPGAVMAGLAFLAAWITADTFLIDPLRNRFTVTRSGWRVAIGRRWYRARSIVLLDGEPLYVLGWWRSDAPDPAVWVYAMPAELPGDDEDGEIGWFLLERLTPGPSRKVWRRVLREGQMV